MALIPAVYARETQSAFLFLLTIFPADGSAPLRAVNNLEDVTSRGNVYTAFPFSISLPPDTGEKRHTLTLVIDNVDGSIMQVVRALAEPPRMLIELVLSDSPDIVEKRIDFLKLASVSADTLQVSGTLTPENMLSRQYPAATYNPREWPALFA